MIVLKGKSVFGGVAFGKLHFLNKNVDTIPMDKVENTEEEIARFEAARQASIEQLQSLYEKAVAEVGEENAMIMQIHQMMLEDLDYVDSVKEIIREQHMNVVYAVNETGNTFANMFASMDDEYMRERSNDVKDISNRLIAVLTNKGAGEQFSEPVIIAADDLAPSETIQLDKSKILSFITRKGSVNSHTAILARNMNIPAILDIGDELKDEYNGMETIIDGFEGKIYISPDETTRNKMQAKKQEADANTALLEQLKGQENVTLDGKKINVYSNIGEAADVVNVLNNDAGGIGLLRSEFIYLESKTFPTEEEQFEIYKYIAEKMDGKKVIIRTLDIGADKQADYFNLPLEENPAMGYRAIRICLMQPNIFKTQLRALYRAAHYGNISIMFPMITSVEEVREIKVILQEVIAELKAEGAKFREKIELGIMIETPAAVMISDLLAKEVDFFSIGTNDLTQYTTAIDRQNPKLDKFYNPHHLALLRMIKMTTDNAHNNGIWVGICGELGGDLELTETFLKMGIDELSVSPSLTLGLRKKIRETDVRNVEYKFEI